MANSGYTVGLSLVVAVGAVAGGYYLSQKQKLAREKAEVTTELPLSKTSAMSLEDYLQEHNKTKADYLAVSVKGCPPRASQEAAPLIEVVVAYRNCSGIGLVPKQ